MQRLSGLNEKTRARLSLLLRSSKGTISIEQASKALQIPAKEAAKFLAHLASQGWLSRARRGLYVPVPLESRSPNPPLEDPWIIANQLFSRCYIGGWSAVEHWGLTEQVFKTIFVMTTKKPRDRKPIIKQAPFLLKTVPQKAVFGTRSVWRGQNKIEVSDPSRTLVDFLDDPLLGGGIRPTADVMKEYLKSEHKNLDLLLAYVEKLGNRTIYKRLGFLLELFAPEAKAHIEQCRSRISKGLSKLDPSLPTERLATAWNLWIPKNWDKEPSSD